MRAIVAVVLTCLGTGCADDVVCPSVAGFALTSPDGFVELVDGAPATVAWTAAGDPGAAVRLTVSATDLPVTVALPPANLGDGQVVWDGRDAAGAPAPPANYQLAGDVAAVGGCAGAAVTPDGLHLIVVRGVRLPTTALAFTGAMAERPLVVTTVNRAPVPLALALDPDPTVDGDELVVADALIPGEFTPVARTYPFTGATVAGAAIPGGDYRLVAVFAGARVDGPALRWTP